MHERGLGRRGGGEESKVQLNRVPRAGARLAVKDPARQVTPTSSEPARGKWGGGRSGGRRRRRLWYRAADASQGNVRDGSGPAAGPRSQARTQVVPFFIGGKRMKMNKGGRQREREAGGLRRGALVHTRIVEPVDDVALAVVEARQAEQPCPGDSKTIWETSPFLLVGAGAWDTDEYISFIGIRTLFDQITRGYGDHSPLTRPKEEVTHGGRARDEARFPEPSMARSGRVGAPGSPWWVMVKRSDKGSVRRW